MKDDNVHSVRLAFAKTECDDIQLEYFMYFCF